MTYSARAMNEDVRSIDGLNGVWQVDDEQGTIIALFLRPEAERNARRFAAASLGGLPCAKAPTDPRIDSFPIRDLPATIAELKVRVSELEAALARLYRHQFPLRTLSVPPFPTGPDAETTTPTREPYPPILDPFSYPGSGWSVTEPVEPAGPSDATDSPQVPPDLGIWPA